MGRLDHFVGGFDMYNKFHCLGQLAVWLILAGPTTFVGLVFEAELGWLAHSF